MRNNTIKMYLALHIMEDILDHGVPDVVNSSYAESAHIPLAKNTSRNTQKRVASITRQAAHRYHEDLAILVASGDVEFEANMPVSIYLIEVESIFAPTVGIPDFGNNDSDKYLFLFRRREEWPSAWDHFVQYCCKDMEEETLEPEYEDN
jgi:hypothetical protein